MPIIAREVVFPVVGDDAPEVTSLNTANSDDVALRSGLRVLVVEDNELNRQLISRYLDMLACEVRIAPPLFLCETDVPVRREKHAMDAKRCRS